MGTSHMADRPSLDRLKALDSLPDLKSQLKEAKRLCNHNARAEMILRWLMGKLKSSPETCKHLDTWNVLASTLRLVSPQRMALLLNQLPGILQTTCSAQELPVETVKSIARLLKLLLELGQGIDGAAIKSLMSMESAASASFCGSWFRHVLNCYRASSEHTISSSLMSPGLQMWDLRKRHDSDDANFNSHCLVQVLQLIALVGKDEKSGSKRKREQTASGSVQACERDLEALVAKHTILPARNAFFRKSDPQARRLQRGLAQVSIEEALVALKKSVQEGCSQNWLVSAPRILDIALRSVSAPTPRHRIKERPWIVSIFAAVQGCFDGQSDVTKNSALVQLLRAIRINRAGLPLETLTDLVNDTISGAVSSEAGADWELVAAVVQLDPTVVANQASTNKVFDQITKEHQGINSDEPRISIWRDQIILPTMRAYAQSRTLAAFTDCWNKQLLVSKSANYVSVWDSIGDCFADLLENSLTADTILELIGRYAASVEEASESKEKLGNSETSCKLRAALCVLEAILKGVRSDALIMSLHSGLHDLLNSLFGLSELKGFKTTLAHDFHYWQVLTRVFELWYPHWASTHNERKTVTSMGYSLLSNKSFKLALVQSSSEDADQAIETKTRTGSSALRYIATLCHCFNQYDGEDGCYKLCGKALDHIAEHRTNATLVFLEFPALLTILPGGLRQDLIRSQLQTANEKQSDAHDIETQLRAILCAFQGTDNVPVLEEFVSVAIEQLKASPKTEGTFMSLMAGVDAATLDQTQRTHVLNTLLELQSSKKGQAGAAQLQCRLALILKLASLPCSDARLLTDASALWDIANLIQQDSSSHKYDASWPSSLDSARLLEGITTRIMRTWLATQDREKSRNLLVQMSRSIKDRLKSAKKAGKLSAGKDGLPIMKVAIEMIEADARDAVKQLMAHREAKTARAYVDLLMGSVETYASSTESPTEERPDSEADCVALLEALLDLPETFLTAAGIDHTEHANQVTQIANKIWAQSPAESSDLRSAIAAASFQLVCKHGQIPVLGKHLLRGDSSAREQSNVISAYEDGFKKAADEWKVNQMAGLQDIESPSTLLLQQATIRALNKEVFDSASNMSPTTYLYCNLQAATQADDFLSRRTALQSLAVIFKEKPFMANQFGIEQTLSVVQTILRTCSYAGALYLDITHVLTALFAHHRSRLQGRFHLVVSLLQSLLTYLFHASPTSPPELSIRQARALARLLESFSNPPPLRHHRGKTSELVDEARKAQAHAGQFTQYLLHHYCAQVLTGNLGKGVREVLLPGIWAIIEAMEVHSQDAIKSLSAAVNNSERAVLRSVYEDWKKFGKWEGL